MPNSLDTLQQAVQAERLDVQKHQERYELLCRRMDAYQTGSGPSPTIEEFEQWRVDVERMVQLRTLHNTVEKPSATSLDKPIVQGVTR